MPLWAPCLPERFDPFDRKFPLEVSVGILPGGWGSFTQRFFFRIFRVRPFFPRWLFSEAKHVFCCFSPTCLLIFLKRSIPERPVQPLQTRLSRSCQDVPTCQDRWGNRGQKDWSMQGWRGHCCITPPKKDSFSRLAILWGSELLVNPVNKIYAVLV